MYKRYQVVTDGYDNGGIDEKQSYCCIRQAVESAEQYLKDGYEGSAIYDIIGGKWHSFYGKFRKEMAMKIEDGFY